MDQEQYFCPIVSDDQQVVWAANKTLCIYEAGKLVLLADDGHTDTIRGISLFERDTIATGGEDKQVILWKKTDKWIPVWRFLHSKRIMSVQFDNAGTLFFADKFGEFYTVKPDQTVSLMFGHLSAVSCMYFGGNFLVSADRDEKIRLAKYPQVEVIESYLFGHKRYVCHLVGDKSGQLVSAGADGRIICWDISDWEHPKQVWTVQLEDGPINSVVFYKNEVYFVRSAEPNTVCILSDGAKSSVVEKKFQIQSLHVQGDVLMCIDSESHLHLNVIKDDTLVSIGADVPGVGISLMKTVHHENLDDTSISFKKKRSEG